MKQDKTSEKSSKGPKVVIIEDDQFLRELASEKLDHEGFIVSSAVDGAEGLRLISQESPDIILLDIILPGIDGFEVLKRIKSNDTMKHTPVIMLSNLGQQTDIDHAMRLGAKDYIVKAHHTLDEIIEKIKQSLHNK